MSRLFPACHYCFIFAFAYAQFPFKALHVEVFLLALCVYIFCWLFVCSSKHTSIQTIIRAKAPASNVESMAIICGIFHVWNPLERRIPIFGLHVSAIAN